MDEASVAAIKEDGAENQPFDGASENSFGSPAEDTEDRIGVFCCRDCGEAFREEAAYLEHRQQHPQQNCGVYIDDQLDGLHDSEKDIDATNDCTLCSLSFVEPSEFHSHMEKNHGQTSQKESGIQMNSGAPKQHTYECADCGKSYGVIGHFLNHQRSHRQASKSVFHDLEHLKKKSFQCESCGRNYSRASALDAHRRCHEEKLVKSRNRSSGDSYNIDESIVEPKPGENQSDDSEKLFKCSCGKAFTALLRLKTHQRFSRNSQCTPEEMKEKPKKSCNEFYCSECKKVFNGHIALFNHQRWHANHSNDSAKRFPCEECGKVFMTLTFYYRHQRTAHSVETPAKSFHHQVCQLQKKAFECKDCGLKFSRASALHSHQLHHTDVFRETEEAAQKRVSLLPQEKILEGEGEETEKLEERVESENVLLTNVAEEDVNETDEEMESYEPGDFNVQVISASESEDEPIQDLNPDLELLCESDQEGRDEGEIEISPISVVSKPEMDLKIVQIDFDPIEEQCTLVTNKGEDKTTAERFDCPDCYRWFTSASSLRVHRMWHGIHKRRQQTQEIQPGIVCKDCGMKFTCLELFNSHLHQHALREDEEDEAAQTGDNPNPATEMDSGEDIDQDGDADWCDMNSSSETKPSGLIQGVAVAKTSMNKLRKAFACLVCGKVYTYLVSFRKHQQLHEKQIPEPKSVQSLQKYECPECGMSFIRHARLLGHMRIHRPREPPESGAPRCDQCNRDFRSMEAWMAHVDHHKQKPFWCLSCAKGFRDEESLDRHLQNHNLKKYECNICHKRFLMSSQLRNHYSIHDGAKPFQGSFGGMSFSHPRNLVSHRKKHLRVYGGSSGLPLGIKSSVNRKKQMIKRKRLFLTCVKEEPEMERCPEKLPSMEDAVTKIETHCEDAEFEDEGNSEESDCGEPLHHFKLSKPSASPGSDPPDEPKAKTVQPQMGPELDGNENQDKNMHREHKYWEWECIECDMGFDDVANLHLHYIKHATGELPILHADIEG